jgi:AraC-like DNA-binding protein
MCRTAGRLVEFLHDELVDAVVVDVRAEGTKQAAELIRAYPRIPFFALSVFRPDDGRLLARCRTDGFRGIIVRGVDDAVAAEMIASVSASRVRRSALASGPRLLRLTEPLQLRTWEEVLASAGGATRTSDIARTLKVTREYLSREFAAGGAPNLKRLIDLVRVAWAADLLGNPGYDVRTVSRILRYSSASHFAGSVRRVAGTSATELGKIGPEGVLRRFARGRTRSRL